MNLHISLGIDMFYPSVFLRILSFLSYIVKFYNSIYLREKISLALEDSYWYDGWVSPWYSSH